MKIKISDIYTCDKRERERVQRSEGRDPPTGSHLFMATERLTALSVNFLQRESNRAVWTLNSPKKKKPNESRRTGG